jgi:hypothetical protein
LSFAAATFVICPSWWSDSTILSYLWHI